MTLNEWFKKSNFKGYQLAPLVTSGKRAISIPYGHNLENVLYSLSNDATQKVVATWMGYNDMPSYYDPKLRRRLRDKIRRDNKPNKDVCQPQLPLTTNDTIEDPLRKILNDIDEILQHNTQEARDLWMILSALRGPDDSGDAAVEAKNVFTCFIRSKVFPKTAERKEKGNGGVYYPKFHYRSGPINSLEYASLNSHYKHHVGSATDAMVRYNIITKDECPEQIRPI